MENIYFIKINNFEYPAISIIGKNKDQEWDNRASKAITLSLSFNEVYDLFSNQPSWSIVEYNTVQEVVTDENNNLIYDINGNIAMTEKTNFSAEYDNSDYNILGDIIVHRDDTITVKMGKLTELEEAYELMLGGI